MATTRSDEAAAQALERDPSERRSHPETELLSAEGGHLRPGPQPAVRRAPFQGREQRGVLLVGEPSAATRIARASVLDARGAERVVARDDAPHAALGDARHLGNLFRGSPLRDEPHDLPSARILRILSRFVPLPEFVGRQMLRDLSPSLCHEDLYYRIWYHSVAIDPSKVTNVSYGEEAHR